MRIDDGNGFVSFFPLGLLLLPERGGYAGLLGLVGRALRDGGHRSPGRDLPAGHCHGRRVLGGVVSCLGGLGLLRGVGTVQELSREYSGELLHGVVG